MIIMKYALRDMIISFNNNMGNILIGTVLILLIIIAIFSKIVNKTKKISGENSLGCTKEEVLDVILEDRKDVRKYNDLFEGYDPKYKVITIENKKSKEISEIFKVIDYSSHIYEENINLTNIKIKIFEYLAIIVFASYYVLVLWDYLIIVFLSFILAMISLLIRYRVYRKGIKIKQNIILKKFDFTDEEKTFFLKGGEDLQKILNLLKFVVFALVMSLLYSFLIP